MRLSYDYGEAIQVDGRELVPVSRALTIGSFKVPLGLSWNRPAGLLVRRQDGTESWVPIKDYTRRAQLALLVTAMLTMLLAWRGRRT